MQSKVIEFVFECIAVELDMKKHKNIVVSIEHRDQIKIFSVKTWKNYFTLVMPSNSSFVCGDFNIVLLKHESHGGTKHFIDCMYGLGLYSLIDRKSQITTSLCTLINNIFTNQINYSVISGLLINDIKYDLEKNNETFKICKKCKR